MKITILPVTIKILAVLTTLNFCTDSVESFAFTHHLTTGTTTTTTTTNLNLSSEPTELNKAPTFNGQLILPVKVVLNGLQNHKVAAVYAIQPSRTKGYAAVTHISITKDLKADLNSLISYMDQGKGNGKGSKQIGFVRALSFAYPQKTAMEEVMQRWVSMVIGEGGTLGFLDDEDDDEVEDEQQVVATQGSSRTEAEKEELVKLMEATADYDSDDDDDDEFEMDSEESSSNALFLDRTQTQTASKAPSPEKNEEGEVISPFEIPTYASTASEETKLEFNLSTVDKVLDEIRPYLISDGGNVSIHSVNEETRSVYLVLEGACGSCASSTVTMQLGIERVLKENFDNIGEVAQVELEVPEGEEGEGGDPTGLTMEAVMKEVSRIAPAISAMGGNVEVLSVDPLGVVEIRFRGANKVQQGLELALRDVKFVKHVKFVN
jgi:Fe-S cluster biogenesis protein NfuA